MVHSQVKAANIVHQNGAPLEPAIEFIAKEKLSERTRGLNLLAD